MTAESTKVRVLINAIHARSGGGVTHLLNLVPLLAKEPDLDLHLLVLPEQQPELAGLADAAEMHAARAPAGLARKLVWEQLRVPGIARRLGADVTFSPANYGPLFAPRPVILLRNALGVRGGGRALGRATRLSGRRYWLGNRLLTVLSLMTCRRAMAVSDYARRMLASGLARPMRQKVSIVPHGVGIDFSPSRSDSGPDNPGQPRFILSVSDIYIQKNVLTLIHAFARVRKQLPDIELRIAGKPLDRDYLAEIEAAVAGHGIEDAVHFMGHQPVSSLAGLYRGCAVFAFPSTVETFGHPLVEAMASGAAIACSNSSAMPEIAGDAALTFNPADEIEMAETLLRILNDASCAAELRQRAVARAGVFSWEAAASATAEVLRAAAGRQSGQKVSS